MSASPVFELPHPLVVAVEQIEGALDQMTLAAWDGMAPTAIKPLVERLMRVEARVKAHQIAAARVLDASGLAKQLGARSTGAMLAGSFGADQSSGDRMVRAGKALAKASRTEEALASGVISQPQAEAIASGIADLPDDTTTAQREACEDTLIGDAGAYSLKDLRTRSARITDQFKPEPEVDAIEDENLKSTERSAWLRSEFWMADDHDGTSRGAFRIPTAQADMLMAAIKAVCAPKRDHLRDHPGTADADGNDSVYDRDLEHRTRLGMGFAEVCSRLPGHLLPGRSGLGATLMVRLELKTLTDGIKSATLSTGTRVSASQARLMACSLGIIPQVFGGKSLPLDHGHEQRLFTKAQKQGLDARDGGCTFPGCDRPPEDCESHHWREPWALGATTNLEDGVLVCPFHHRVIHADDWQLRLGPRDHIEYKSPGSTVWQRNHRWRP